MQGKSERERVVEKLGASLYGLLVDGIVGTSLTRQRAESSKQKAESRETHLIWDGVDLNFLSRVDCHSFDSEVHWVRVSGWIWLDSVVSLSSLLLLYICDLRN